ncbi:MAG: TetR family transcriptional regulator C-terminal domain-containing protein [Actinomycetota bacterium]|nr:TetR family transcriptional regulator C-terminal domain-containing protein [Actinomycetota bacterium]
MPKIVDHDERRRELARAALDVISRSGLEAATIRAVAEESGWSTGVLKHYYVDKDELLHESLREMERANLARFDAAQQQPTGLDAITAIVAAIRRAEPRETRLWIAFTSRACVDPAIASMMRHAIEVWVARWAALVVRGQHDGSIRPDIDPARVAREIHALVNGLRLREQFRPAHPSPEWPAFPGDPVLLDSLRAR